MTTTRIEAEDLTLSGAYGVSNFSVASSGQGISLPRHQSSSGASGGASHTFTGNAGTYDLDIGYFKERDGGATIKVVVNGVDQGTIYIYSKSADSSPTTNSFAIQTYALNLNPGDVITLSAQGSNWSHAVVDYIELTGDGPANNPPIAAADSAATDEDNAIVIDVLANDSDSDGGTLSVATLDTTGTAGQVTNNGTDVTYDPDDQFEYLDQGESATNVFSYTTTDGQGGTDTATVTVTVSGVNDAPVAANDTASTDKLSLLSVAAAGGVLANDTDPDAADDPVVSAVNGSAAAVGNQITLASGALLTVAADGSYDYDPNGQFAGLGPSDSTTDSFTYTVTDGDETDTATMVITVNGINLSPTADDDSDTAGEDTSIAIDVLANDTDPDAGTLGVQTVDTTGTSGQVANNGTDVTYDPNGQFEYLDQGESATDVFTYTTTDGQGGTDTATVTITVTGIDDAPIAVDDGPIDTDEDTPVVIPVLANDSDPDDVLIVTGTSDGANGAVITNGTTVTYTPDTGFTGTDSFTYAIDDGAGTTDSATVTVNVAEIPAGPAYALRVQELDPLAYWRLEETAGTVAADSTGNGHDGAYGSAAALDQNGVLPGSLDNAARSDGTSNVAEVAHDAAFLLDDGSISLWFNADRVDQTQGLITKDAYGNGTGGHFRIILRADGVLNTRIQTTSTSHSIQSSAGAVDADQWHHVVLNFGSGGLALYLDGQLVGSNGYTGGLGATSGGTGNLEPFTLGSNQGLSSAQSSDGENGFLHGVLDEVSLFGRALSTQEIAELHDLGINGPPNAPPVAIGDSDTTDEDSSITIDVLANDSDSDGGTLSVAALDTTGTVGQVTNNGTGVAYDPNGQFEYLDQGESATDTFTYTTADNLGGTDTATVTVTVSGVNDAPVAANDTASTDKLSLLSVAAAGGVLANDTDPDAADDPVVSAVNGSAAPVGNQITLASGALLTVAADGSYDYDPNGQFAGLGPSDSTTDSFTYTVTDGDETDTATMVITVNGINLSPTADDDSDTADEDASIAIDVLANDTDPDAGTLGVQTVDTTGTIGQVTNNGTNVTYDPNGQFEYLDQGESVTDVFTYTTTDGQGGTDTATVTITVTGIDDAPIAVDDGPIDTDEDTPVVIPVLANDSDPDDVLIVTDASDGGNGTVTTNGTTVTYTPDAGFTGTDSFTYTIDDGAGTTDSATVTVNVAATPAGPAYALRVQELDPLAYWRLEETDGTVAADSTGNGHDGAYGSAAALDQNGVLPGSLDNAARSDGTSNVAEVAHDAAFLLDDGSISLWFNADRVDQTQGLITKDAYGNGTGGHFRIILRADGVLNTRIQTTSTSHSIQSSAGAVDADQWHHVVLNFGSGGLALYLDGQLVGSNGYTGGLGATSGGAGNLEPFTLGSNQGLSSAQSSDGENGFLHGVLDEVSLFGQALSAQEIAELHDLGINGPPTTPPVAGADSAATDEDTSVAIDVLANDSDSDGGTLSVDSVDTGATAGLVTNNNTGVTYDPNGQFEYLDQGESATDTFTYTTADGQGGSDTATVTVTITGADDAPIAVDDGPFNTGEGTQIVIPVLANDSDPDDSLTVTDTTDGGNGTVATNGTTVTYSPNGGFTGTDSFTYTIDDGAGTTDSATVTVTVGAPAISPDDLAGLALWLDAADTGSLTTSGASVSAWQDKSGGGHHFTQSSSSSRPELVTAQSNGRAAVRTDGSNDFLAADFSDLSLDGMTLFMVAAVDQTDANAGIFSVYDDKASADNDDEDAFVLKADGQGGVTMTRELTDPDPLELNGLDVDSAPAILVAAMAAATAKLEVNGGADISDTYDDTDAMDPTDATLGARWRGGALDSGNRGANDYHEVLLYDRVLTNQEIIDVNAYLAGKWGISVGASDIDFEFVPFAGQSNAYGHFDTASGAGVNSFLSDLSGYTGADSTTAINTASGASAVDRIAAPDWGPNRYWWDLAADAPGPLLTAAIADIRDQGVTPTGIVWAQGEQDGQSLAGYEGTPTTIARYKQATEAVFDYFRGELDLPDLPIYMQHIGPYIGSAGQDAHHPIRQAQSDMADDLENVFIAASSYDQPLSDNVHFTGDGYATIGARLARYIAHEQGEAGVTYGTGPQIQSAQAQAGNTQVMVTLSHDGGSTFTPTSSIDGFYLEDSGGQVTINSAVRQSPIEIKLTLAEALTGAATLHYINENTTWDNDDIVTDNASPLSLPLEAASIDIWLG